MATQLTEDALFRGQPGVWLDSQTATWAHRGHASEDSINAHLATAFAPLDEMQVIPGTLRYQWLRVTVHGSESDGDVDMRWEAVEPGADGALPVTVVTVTSVDEFGDV